MTNNFIYSPFIVLVLKFCHLTIKSPWEEAVIIRDMYIELTVHYGLYVRIRRYGHCLLR